MRVAYSKVLSKGRTILPRLVCDELDLRPGNTLRYRIRAERVLLDKMSAEASDPLVVFSEWWSDFDERAYADL
jgi:bifunctional DNA-binding transcriptional regulator/antitoxin component of YhaV-PrlF toxin-antitoxin module